jgi:hypothetical protein
MMLSYAGKKWDSTGQGGAGRQEAPACRYYFRNFGKDACGNGLPVMESYGRRICSLSPEKCPVFRWKSSLKSGLSRT